MDNGLNDATTDATDHRLTDTGSATLPIQGEIGNEGFPESSVSVESVASYRHRLTLK